MADETVQMAHGAGGKLSQQLMEEYILPALGNAILNDLHDGAVLSVQGPVAFTTDSFVVHPLFFPGGSIGRLAVCGTVNDLAGHKQNICRWRSFLKKASCWPICAAC